MAAEGNGGRGRDGGWKEKRGCPWHKVTHQENTTTPKIGDKLPQEESPSIASGGNKSRENTPYPLPTVPGGGEEVEYGKGRQGVGNDDLSNERKKKRKGNEGIGWKDGIGEGMIIG